ncbi:MAG: hypothetical protein NC935_02645, partial [Candidatus Omnitrophica bacterium]|nr:hypothetical protein [Candidatus Omnitrophota bacterium]
MDFKIQSMNIYFIFPLFTAILVLYLGVFLFLKNRDSGVHRSFFYMCLSIFGWMFSYSIVYFTNSLKIAFYLTKLGCVCAMFTAPTQYHLAVNYLNKINERKLVKIVYYFASALFLSFMYTKYFLDVPYRYYWGYYSKAGILHPLYILFHFSVVGRSIIILSPYREDNLHLFPQKRIQIRYLFLAFIIGSLAAVDLVQKYGIEFYPIGFIFLIIFPFIIFYAILKHRLLDIRVIITRATIFIFLYSLIFALP